MARRTYLGPKLLNKLPRELRTLTSLGIFENCIPKCDLSLLVNKETRTNLPSPAFVLEVPQCNLRTSMCDFVPCDRIVQRFLLFLNCFYTIDGCTMYVNWSDVVNPSTAGFLF